jgi:hypothetical protein
LTAHIDAETASEVSETIKNKTNVVFRRRRSNFIPLYSKGQRARVLSW